MTDTPKTHIASRADLRAVLQRAGIARAAADIVAQAGFAALVEQPHIDNEEDLTMSIQTLREKRAEKAAALKALAAKPNFFPKDQTAHDQLTTDLDNVDADIARYQADNEKIAADVHGVPMSQGGFSGGEDLKYLAAFTNVLRNLKDLRARQSLADLNPHNVATGATDPAGGCVVPEFLMSPLMSRAVNANPFRDLVRTINVSSRDIVIPLSNANSTTGWVGEGGPRVGTTEATLHGARPTFGTLYSYVEATEELVMDAAFDIGNWFAMEAGNAMGEAEMAAIISGSGVDRPSGLLADPADHGCRWHARRDGPSLPADRQRLDPGRGPVRSADLHDLRFAGLLSDASLVASSSTTTRSQTKAAVTARRPRKNRCSKPHSGGRPRMRKTA
jgi:hypothetical protein